MFECLYGPEVGSLLILAFLFLAIVHGKSSLCEVSKVENVNALPCSTSLEKVEKKNDV
jgi:hypothetical protein